MVGCMHDSGAFLYGYEGSSKFESSPENYYGALLRLLPWMVMVSHEDDDLFCFLGCSMVPHHLRKVSSDTGP